MKSRQFKQMINLDTLDVALHYRTGTTEKE